VNVGKINFYEILGGGYRKLSNLWEERTWEEVMKIPRKFCKRGARCSTARPSRLRQYQRAMTTSDVHPTQHTQHDAHARTFRRK